MKPCPFCGEKRRMTYRSNLGLIVVHCEECGARGPEGKGFLSARAKWNIRLSTPIGSSAPEDYDSRRESLRDSTADDKMCADQGR